MAFRSLDFDLIPSGDCSLEDLGPANDAPNHQDLHEAHESSWQPISIGRCPLVIDFQKKNTQWADKCDIFLIGYLNVSMPRQSGCNMKYEVSFVISGVQIPRG